MTWQEAVRERLQADDVAGAYEVAVNQAIDELDLRFDGEPRTDDVAVAAFQARAAVLLRECGVTVKRDRIEWWEAEP